MHIKNKFYKLILLFILFNFIILPAFSTVDYLAVNRITKEFAVIEDNEYPGLGWQSVGELSDEKWLYYEKVYLPRLGYKQAEFRYKIEIALIVLLIFSISIVQVIRYKRIRSKN